MAKRQPSGRKVSGGCGKGTAAKKISKGPKRKPAGFLLYCSEVRRELMKRYPEMKQTEIAKRAGACWRNLCQTQRDLYNARACGGCPRCPTCKRPFPKKSS